MIKVFVIADGDNVRKHIDRLMLLHSFNDLRNLSENIDKEIEKIIQNIERNNNIDVIYKKGDGFLLITPRSQNLFEILLDTGRNFVQTTGISISFGVSRTVEGAIIALKKAKATNDETVKLVQNP